MRTHSESIDDLVDVFNAGEPMSDRKAQLYLMSLEDIPADHLEVVVQRIIKTRKSAFLPTPGEINDAYTNLLMGPPKPSESLDWCLSKHRELEKAFNDAYFAKPVLERGARGNYYPKPPTAFPDPVTAETVRLCDWAELIEMDKDYRKGYFDKKYAAARESVAKRIQAGELRLELPEPSNGMAAIGGGR